MENRKIDCLAIIGAGQAALPIINKAKIMNIETIAFGPMILLQRIVLIFLFEENSFHVALICEMCNQYQVNGVIASNELTTEVAAKVPHQSHLPGNKIDGGFAVKNRYLMKMAKITAIKVHKTTKI